MVRQIGTRRPARDRGASRPHGLPRPAGEGAPEAGAGTRRCWSASASDRGEDRTRRARGSSSRRCMLAIGLAAIDSTIVATAIPQIVGDLGGFSQFPWLFSIYLLAQAVLVPIYGRLSRRLRPQADAALRDRRLPPRLGALRRGVEHGLADRLPRRPGDRRRGDHPDHVDDRRRPLLAGRAGQGPGVRRERLGDQRGCRSVARRPVRRVLDVARDLLHQHSPGARGGRASSRSTCTSGSSRGAIGSTRAARPSSRSRSRC